MTTMITTTLDTLRAELRAADWQIQSADSNDNPAKSGWVNLADVRLPCGAEIRTGWWYHCPGSRDDSGRGVTRFTLDFYAYSDGCAYAAGDLDVQDMDEARSEFGLADAGGPSDLLMELVREYLESDEAAELRRDAEEWVMDLIARRYRRVVEKRHEAELYAIDSWKDWRDIDSRVVHDVIAACELAAEVSQ